MMTKKSFDKKVAHYRRHGWKAEKRFVRKYARRVNEAFVAIARMTDGDPSAQIAVDCITRKSLCRFYDHKVFTAEVGDFFLVGSKRLMYNDNPELHTQHRVFVTVITPSRTVHLCNAEDGVGLTMNPRDASSYPIMVAKIHKQILTTQKILGEEPVTVVLTPTITRDMNELIQVMRKWVVIKTNTETGFLTVLPKGEEVKA